jgi:hypothetical protein
MNSREREWWQTGRMIRPSRGRARRAGSSTVSGCSGSALSSREAACLAGTEQPATRLSGAMQKLLIVGETVAARGPVVPCAGRRELTSGPAALRMTLAQNTSFATACSDLTEIPTSPPSAGRTAVASSRPRKAGAAGTGALPTHAPPAPEREASPPASSSGATSPRRAGIWVCGGRPPLPRPGRCFGWVWPARSCFLALVAGVGSNAVRVGVDRILGQRELLSHGAAPRQPKGSFSSSSFVLELHSPHSTNEDEGIRRRVFIDPSSA